MLAVAARCIRLLPLRAPRALPPPSLALRARAPARAFAPRSLAVAAMDSSDVEAKAAKLPAVTAAGEEIAPAAKAEKKPRARKAPAKKEKAGDDAEGGDAEAAGEKAAKKPKAEVEKAVLPRSDTPRKPPPAGPAFKALCWNVAGLRAVLNNGTGAVLQRLVTDEAPDVICLQEHKLQLSHVAEVEEALRSLLGPAYGAFYWAVSLDKKGYSGVVLIARGPRLSVVGGAAGAEAGPAPAAGAKQKTLGAFFAKAPGAAAPAADAPAAPAAAGAWGAAGAPQRVSFGLGAAGAHAQEGRTVTLEFASFALVIAYVPNAGEGLKRVDFRVDSWEVDMRAYLLALAAGGKPVVYGGDLNVAHADGDIWNPTAKHIAKSAGTSPGERAAFGQMLTECGLVDTFRAVHPDAQHCYSYWSQRAGNRPFNRGLRLDYFVASQGLAGASSGLRLHDAFICSGGTDGVSDHAPSPAVMGASYAETFAYDLVVVFFVAIVMPISVLLLRSNTAAGKLSGATLLGLSVLYVGGFEHYRLHAPELASERVRAMLLASDPARKRLLAELVL